MTIDELDLTRRKSTVGNTDNFTKTIDRLNKICGISMSGRGLAKLLMVEPHTILRWEKANLIFPKKRKSTQPRIYKEKDILRGLTIKFLMSELGFRKYYGVKLLLSITNRSLNGKHRAETIDNIYIDKYLMRVLNYDIEAISKMKLHANSRRYKDGRNLDDEYC